ncbi:hypothetical protein [Flavobacterium humidisoli]|uniref:Uncharacterized protein n=1 Tax=Flavobacterium humidisoli TaxID=2937442 RepID=A0ABY4M1Q9_9FLAO|nr:hypothetical protein [Flavobacterium humidisoli]UPZ17786.1 hypothetical protein M0M44_10650 [Flavobacterium humidisoli]
MSKNTIHNFNLSIQNSAEIQNSEHLTETIIKELAKVSNEMNQQKDIAQLWQEQQDKNASLNVSNFSTEGGATETFAKTKEAAQSVSNTPSVSGKAIGNETNNGSKFIEKASLTTFSAPIAEGFSDTTRGTILGSSASVITTSPILGVENDLNSEFSSQVYSNVSFQEVLSVPQAFHTNSNEPTIEAVKAEIKKKLEEAIKANDIEMIKYWTRIDKALEEEVKLTDFKNELAFAEMYKALKQSQLSSVEIKNFNWELVREKMIAAIDANLLKGKISKVTKIHWDTIKKQLADDKINIANLFERYDELFLLLKEVEGLNALPNTITITTKTKIYPNLSNPYAAIGKEDVYTFLKTINNVDVAGSSVKPGAVKIKNSNETSFIVGESLEFFLDETLLKQEQKENINWIIYKDAKKIGAEFVDKGTSFTYNFDTPGSYIVEAYGLKPGANKKATASKSAFVKLNIIAQEIVITPPANIQNKLARNSVGEQLFKVSLKNPEIKTLNPVKLYYQIAYKNRDKVTTILEEKELDSTGIIKLAMHSFGEYAIKIASKDQYGLIENQIFKVIKNFVESIDILSLADINNDVYLWNETNRDAIFVAQSFKIEPTQQERENVKWLVYEENGKTYVPDGLKLQTENDGSGIQYLYKGETFILPIPKKDGVFIVEAYSNIMEGLKSKSIKKIYVKYPKVTETFWAYGDGNKKQTSGFSGEINHIKARIPDYLNQPVRIKFFLNDSKEVNYYNDTKTNGSGEINKSIKFDATLQKHFGIQKGKTAKIRFELEGIKNGKPYLFKKDSNVYDDAVLNVTTVAKVTDAYFVYDGNRVSPFTQVPYGAKVTGVVKTLNMVGKEAVLKVYKDYRYPKHSIKIIVDSEGTAKIDFTLNKKWQEINFMPGLMDMFYIAMVGVESKLYSENGLNAIVVNNDTNVTTSNSVITDTGLGIIWGAKVSPEFRKKVVQICKELWGEENKLKMANQLMICMNVETKGTFSASVGYPKATGLIQFTGDAIDEMNRTHRGKKYTGPDYKDKLLTKSDLKNMTEIRQLNFVKLYFQMHLERYKRTIDNAEDMYMAIFAPIGVGKDGSEVLYDKALSPKNYGENKSADGEYWDEKQYQVVKGKKDQKITKNELTPRIKQSIHLGKMYAIEIDETRNLDVVLAEKIIKEKKIKFSSIHPYLSTNDRANADDNIKDASEGNKVYTSEYGHARGKQVKLSVGVLYVLHELSKKYKFNVQELAGASHSSGSQHYKGTAIDINEIDGKHVDSKNYDEEFYVELTKAVKEMGAVNVFHPYYSATRADRETTEERRKNLRNGEKLIPKSDHWNHIHIQF